VQNQPKGFIYTYIFLLAIGAMAFLILDKNASHLYVNKFHFHLADLFFSLITYLGDGIFVILIAIIISLYNSKAGLLIISSYLLSAGITQGLKHLFFDDWMRPAGVFQEIAKIEELYLVPGVEIHYHNSFPSGHSTSAFALFFSISYFVSNNFVQFALLLLAVLTAFSRVYLSQHFFIDIYAGSFIACICVYVLYNYWIKKMNNKYDKSILLLNK
jgi:membrane-associated phospholipid phosphatase